MYKLKYFLFVLLFSAPLFAQAQEICDNGIDDDGDGFIDCFDPDCALNSLCDGSYVGNDANCEAPPTDFPDFTMTLDFSTPDETTNHLGRIAIGDLDRDGIPEIISNNRYSKRIYILNGDDGSIKYQQNVDYSPRWEAAIGNLNDDNCAEIFFWGVLGGENYIISYDCQLNELWRVQVQDDPGNYGLADFNRDGQVELYLRNEIRDASTGAVLVAGNNWNDVNAGPVAADLTGDGDLELVLGGILYDVNLAGGTLTEIDRIPNYYRRSMNDATSIADYNQDGFLDVIAVGSENGKNQNTTVFFWDVQNNQVSTFSDPIPGLNLSLSCQGGGPQNYYTNGWINGTGRVNIADLDGDGNLNASFVSGRYLYALDENFNLLWRVIINEETSGYTGCTLFDFNGDGKSEVVYRDEQYIYIINGEDGTIYNQQRCISRTNREYPIVADVDADGSTEICVPCGFDDAESWNNFCSLGYSRYSHIRIFKSNSQPWVPARRLWNQHGYFNVNVNDDLTIPQEMQKHHLVWSTGTCTQGENRPLNTFLNQSPYLNSEGCPTYVAPDLAFVDGSLAVTNPICPERDFNVSFQIQNIGDASLSGNLPVSFYNGDPLAADAIWLGTQYFTLNNFDPGDVFDVTDLLVTGPGSNFELFIVLNDDGSSIPTPIALPNTNFSECNYANNVVNSTITPGPFQIEVESTDNFTCVGNAVPANGSARAYRLVGNQEQTTDYIFEWWNGTDISGAPAFTGAVYSGLEAGTYTVIATHKTANCSSDPAEVTIGQQIADLNAEIVIEKPYDDCKKPNGKLRVIVNGGDPVGKFTYEWYVGNTVGGGIIISKSHVAADLEPIVYTVLVTDKATGCTFVVSEEVPDLSVRPEPNLAITNIVCSDANSGSVSADVMGNTNNYFFDWYIGPGVKPSSDYTGSTINNLAAGTYTLRVTDKSKKCTYDSTFVIEQTVPPVIDGVSAVAQTSCDPNNNNGSVSMTFTGDPADYLIEWFSGQNTLAANKVGEGQTLAGLAQGVYTVKLTDIATGCFATAQTTVVNNVVIPTLSAAATDATTCVPDNGAVTASVSAGNISDYIFFWYDGNQVKASPDYSEQGNVLSDVGPGVYTVFAINQLTGCEVVSPQTVTINNNTPAISISQVKVNEVPPSDCNSTGSLEVEVNQPGNTQGFTLEWYEGRAPFANPPIKTVNDAFSDVLDGIGAGVYSVVATDPASGCSSTESFVLEFVDLHTVAVTPNDNTNCTPENGSLDIVLDTKGLDASGFTMEVYAGSNTTGTPIETINGVTGQTNYTSINTLAGGEYTVVAINSLPGFNDCRSIPVTVEIMNVATGPVLAINAQGNNTACTGGTFNGFAELDIDGGSNPANYTITWYEGQNITTAPVLGTNVGVVANNGERANQLKGGVYTAEVTNSLGCTTVISVNIIDDAPILSIDVMPVNITSCDMNGNLTDGNATAQVMDEGVPVAGYTLTWTDINGTVIASGPAANNLAPGTYYVTASDAATNCGTTAEFIIEDLTINNPTIQIVDFENPTRCLQIANLTGFLEITIDGNSASGYDITWREDDATGTIIAAGANQTRLDDLTINANFNTDTKSYYVEVVNRDNLCRDNVIYAMEREVVPVNITATATPVTICDPANPDGTLFATVTSGGFNNYTYNWTGTNGFAATGRDVIGVPMGDYTVTAVDNLDAFCTADTLVSVVEEQIYPELMLEALAPNTACVDSLADGVGRATVNGEFVGYTFEWYEGTDLTAAPVYVGSEFFGMKALTYTVVVIDNITGCSVEGTIQIEENIANLPDPTPVVLAHVTSCEEPNGIVVASVEGNTQDYIFEWYMGQDIKPNPDFTGEIWAGVDAGFYTVRAISRITGCIVGPATVEVLENLSYPEFEFNITAPTCDSNNGFVELIMLNDVEIRDITWTAQNGTVYYGPNLSEVPAGIYEVTVTSHLGCSTTSTLELIPEIEAFNGVSRNGDNRNDFFRIGCITDYPQNLVKIFNRAGTLVYEMEGYDNATKYFDGTSNRGISVMGVSLPDGTYYYVIDKRDGSKPIAGYLEIVQ